MIDLAEPTGPWAPDTLIRLVRYDFVCTPGTDERTLGRLFINPSAWKTDILEGMNPSQTKLYSCEDLDRGLSADMESAEFIQRKIPHFTAIPVTTKTHRYRIIWRWSDKHKCHLPGIEDVPAFRNIEIHSGNVPANTDGCVLPGLTRAADAVEHSRDACHFLYPVVEHFVGLGPQFLEVERDAAAWAERLAKHPEYAYSSHASYVMHPAGSDLQFPSLTGTWINRGDPFPDPK